MNARYTPNQAQSRTHHLPRRLRAEWEHQRAVLLSFPHERSDWASQIDRARECFLHIIESIIAFESVLVCIDCEDYAGLQAICARFAPDVPCSLEITPFATLALTESITLAFVPTNDTWARDFGAITCALDFAPDPTQPTQTSTPESNLLLHFNFNGWGLKYPANFDNQITRHLHTLGAITGVLESHALVLEGGSIDSDGAGSILTTTACLLEPNRNPTLTKLELESSLREILGIDRVLWLERGYLRGDDTDSHVDMLARFIDEHTIAYVSCDDEHDEHYTELKLMERELQALRTKNGEPYKLIALPFVPAIYDESGERLPASYVNFLFVNGALLVPIYDESSDDLALRLLRSALPDRKVLGVHARTLIEWHGSLHCVSMQLY
ncbi:agmatine deiminase family protein [Helicobacter sp.]|uniref:agmatine deiminase family protein n=1 Tax=Helicobacter sp. TaxID=218 RepID=UPI00388E0694